MTLIEEIKNCHNYDQSQAEIVRYLLTKGYSEKDIQEEIYKVYEKITKEDILRSFSFISILIIIALISLAPLIGYFFQNEISYGIVSLALLFTTYGYYKLKKSCILIWLSLFSLLVLYFLIILLAKFSGTDMNSLYSYGMVFSFLLICSVSLRTIARVYSQNEKLRKQYKFKENL